MEIFYEQLKVNSLDCVSENSSRREGKINKSRLYYTNKRVTNKEKRRYPLTMDYFDNLDNKSLNKYKKS
jgi:hypothetical protein